MKKHTMREHERQFADRLTMGEVFAISETTMWRTLCHELRERGMNAEVIHPINQTREEMRRWRRHWAVCKIVPLKE